MLFTKIEIRKNESYSTLLAVEKKYYQIEKVALTKFLSVKYVKNWWMAVFFVLQTDQRPLLSIYGSTKGVKHTEDRLQHRGTLLLDYDF